MAHAFVTVIVRSTTRTRTSSMGIGHAGNPRVTRSHSGRWIQARCALHESQRRARFIGDLLIWCSRPPRMAIVTAFSIGWRGAIGPSFGIPRFGPACRRGGRN